MDAPRSSVSAMGSTARLRLIAAWAMTSASIRSFLAVPGSISLAPFIDFPGRYPASIPFARQPAHDEGADAVLLVHDDQGGVACLPGQCAGIVQTVLHPPADPDLALLVGPDSPAEGFPGIHAEIEPVGSEPAFLPALHGGSLLIGRLATVPVRATPTLPCRTACRAAHPYQPFPLQGTILRRQRPRAFSEAGQEGRPEEVGQRPREGPSTRLGKSRTWHC